MKNYWLDKKKNDLMGYLAGAYTLGVNKNKPLNAYLIYSVSDNIYLNLDTCKAIKDSPKHHVFILDLIKDGFNQTNQSLDYDLIQAFSIQVLKFLGTLK